MGMGMGMGSSETGLSDAACWAGHGSGGIITWKAV